MNISDILPHAAPMLLLERLVKFTKEEVECSVNTAADGIFVQGGKIDAVVATEWMAQTVGAYVGASRYVASESPRIGFVIGARRVDYHTTHVQVGAALRVHARPIWIDRGNGNFKCWVSELGSDRRIAEGSLTVHEPE